MSVILFCALSNIGKANITPERIGHLNGLLSPADCSRLLVDLTKTPAWMQPHLRHIVEMEETA